MIWRQFLSVRHNYVSPLARRRAQGLVYMIWAAVVVLLALLVFQLASDVLGGVPPRFPLAYVFGIVALLIANEMIQRGRLDAAIWAFVGLLIVVFVPVIAVTIDPTAPVVLLLPLVAAGVLLNRRSLLIIAALVLLSLVLRTVNQSQSIAVIPYNPADNAIPELITYGIFLGFAALFLLAFSGSDERIMAESFADVEHFKAANKFTASLENVTDEPGMFTRVLETVQADLGFDLAQIYLPDAERQFTRRLRLGLGQGVHITLTENESAMLDEVARRRAPIMITTRDERTRSDHLIPPARESVSLALAYGDAVIGILDVQSEQRELFTENSIAALQALAAQAAREIVQLRRIIDLQRNVADQETALNRFVNQMTELQRYSQNVTTTTWSRYLEGRGSTGFGFDYQGGMIIASSDLSDEIRQAVAQGDVYVEQTPAAQIVNVPITLRGQILGALTFRVPLDRVISERQIQMLRTVSNRLGVALESNRLLEQTQAQAQREHTASEIGSLLLSVTDVEAVLDLAAEHFNEALGAVHTRVSLDPGVLVRSGEAS